VGIIIPILQIRKLRPKRNKSELPSLSFYSLLSSANLSFKATSIAAQIPGEIQSERDGCDQSRVLLYVGKGMLSIRGRQSWDQDPGSQLPASVFSIKVVDRDFSVSSVRCQYYNLPDAVG
jgi:hypothetical protein